MLSNDVQVEVVSIDSIMCVSVCVRVRGGGGRITSMSAAVDVGRHVR